MDSTTCSGKEITRWIQTKNGNKDRFCTSNFQIEFIHSSKVVRVSDKYWKSIWVGAVMQQTTPNGKKVCYWWTSGLTDVCNADQPRDIFIGLKSCVLTSELMHWCQLDPLNVWWCYTVCSIHRQTNGHSWWMQKNLWRDRNYHGSYWWGRYSAGGGEKHCLFGKFLVRLTSLV